MVRQAILPETAATLTDDHGEGRHRRHRQERAARQLHRRRQDRHGRQARSTAATRASQQNVSFVGFVPSRDPVLTVIVMIDSPRVGGDTGGAIAAPIFKRIADASLRQLGITPTINPAAARDRRAQPDECPVTQTAAPVAPIVMAMPARHDRGGLPDLRGMSAREALRELARLGMTAKCKAPASSSNRIRPPDRPVEPGASARSSSIAACRRGRLEPLEISGDRSATRSTPCASLVVDATARGARGDAADHRRCLRLAARRRRLRSSSRSRGLRADGGAVRRTSSVSAARSRWCPNRRRPTVSRFRGSPSRDARLALALLADRFFDHPSRRMPVIGVTGTNGKTTTAYLLARDPRRGRASSRHARHRCVSHRR